MIALALMRLAGFRSRWVQTSVGRIHVLEAEGGGDGAPLVLMHGLSSRATHYRALARHLRPHFRRLILFDNPGHGESEVPPVMDGESVRRGCIEVLDTIPEPFLLYGNSLGGYGAMRYAMRSPEHVLRLAVTSPDALCGGGR